jgi:hypothetical protein
MSEAPKRGTRHVTDREYLMDGYLISLLNRCIKREQHNWDNLIIIDGDTGTGKSTFAFQIAYYYAWNMNKEFTVDNVFFESEAMIDYAQTNKNKIIVWDESALDGMAMDWQNQNQKNLVKLLYTARKLGHFLIFIIPEFRKLQSVFALNRSFVLLRVYSTDGIKRGYWKGYSQSSKRALYFSELKYSGGAQIYPNVRGRFPAVNDLIDMKAYDVKKDAAIMSIGSKTKQAEFKVSKLPLKVINKMKDEGLTDAKIAKIFSVTRTHITHLRNKASE